MQLRCQKGESLRLLSYCAAMLTLAIVVMPGAAKAGTDGRVYELVSPPDKNGYPISDTPQAKTGLSALSLDGQRAVFTSYGVFADASAGMPVSYLARRTTTGWVASVASPPPVKRMPNVLTGDATVWTDANPELTAAITQTTDGLDPTDINELGDAYGVGTGISATLISRGNGPVRASDGGAAAAISNDGDAVLFSTSSHLVPEDVNRVAGADVYVRSSNVTRLVSLDSDERAIDTCGSTLGSGFGKRNALSSDGSRVVFTVPDDAAAVTDPACDRPTHIYQRTLAGETIDVSGSQASTADPDGPADAIFQGAARDGSSVVFTSAERLTNVAADGGGIYASDTATRTLRLLVGSDDITLNNLSVVKVSDDAKLIFFMSSAEIEPGMGSGEPALWIYNAETDTASLVATDPTNAIGSDFGSPSEDTRPATFSPRGHLAFESTAKLTSFDNRGVRQVYLYREAMRQLVCVSCDPAGQRPASSNGVRGASLLRPRFGDRRTSFSADGARLVFESGDQLVAADGNAKIDVYEWADDRVQLVSSGRSAQDSYVVGFSGDGQTVLFSTYESLLPQDVDGGNQDMYAARFGGGFPTSKPDVPFACLRDGCQGPLSLQPMDGVPGSQSLVTSEPGNDGASPGPEFRVGKLKPLSKGALSAAARTGVLRVATSAVGKGKVGVRLTARIAGRSRTIGQESKTMNATTVRAISLNIRLSGDARRLLATKGRAVIRIRLMADGRSVGPAKTAVLVTRGARKAAR